MKAAKVKRVICAQADIFRWETVWGCLGSGDVKVRQ